MSIGSPTQTRTKKHLCMGCGKYFSKRAVNDIEGVSFCFDCKDAAEEFHQTIKAEREALKTQQDLGGVEEDKWEAAWSSAGMISITQERLERIPHPVPLDGIAPTLLQRVFSRALDYSFVAVAVLVLDVLVHLTVVATAIFGDLGLENSDLQHASLADLDGLKILFSHPAVARKVGFVIIMVLTLYRFFFYLTMKRTLGQSFAGVTFTTPRGRFPGFASRMIKATSSVLSDAALIGPLVDVVFYQVSKPKVCLSDALAGLRAVRYEEWRKRAAGLLHQTTLTRVGGSPTQETLAANRVDL